MIELTLCNWLRAETNVTNVVPNIFAISLPKNNVYPSLRITRLSSTPTQLYSGLNGEERALIQLDYWSESTDNINEIKSALFSYFDDLPSNQVSIESVHDLREQPSYNENAETFKQTLELTINYTT